MELELQVDAGDDGCFRATMEIRDLQIVTQGQGVDAEQAARAAADLCAAGLRRRGLVVTSSELLALLRAEARAESIH